MTDLSPAELDEVERRAAIPRKLEALLEMERWPAERRAAWVDDRLEAQLAAARRTPWGRERLPAGQASGPVRDRFAAVPALDRATLRDRFDDLRADTAPAPLSHRVTSGSTGRPVRAVHGAETVGWAAAARLRQLAWFGLEATEHPQVNIRIASRAEDPVLWRDPRTPSITWVNPYRLDDGGLERVHDELVAQGGARLLGAESSLFARWAQLYAASKRDARELGVRLAIVGGEMTYPEQRAEGAAVFGCDVAEMYGSHECSLIATECPAGSLHVAEECVLVEVADEDGRPVAAGEQGEVLVTLLHNEEMPLLRYRLGDGASLPAGACSCGRTLACLDVRVGRLEEMVRAPDGSLVHPRFLRSVYERCFGATLRGFHTVQEGPAAFLVQLDLSAAPPPGARARLERDIAAYLRGPVTVRLEIGDAAVADRGLRTFTHAA